MSIRLSSTVTAAIPANITPDKSDDILDLQSSLFPNSTEAKLFFPGLAPYYYDVEVYDTEIPPNVTRYIYGRVLVTSEATR
jgi:hypothetical protein